MRFVVATLMIVSMGAAFAVAAPGKDKNTKETTTSTDTNTKKQNKKKPKKHGSDKTGVEHPETK